MEESGTPTAATGINTYGARVMEPRFGYDVYKLGIKLYERFPLQLFLLGLAFLLFSFFSGVAPLLVQLALALAAPIIGIGILRILRFLDTATDKVTIRQMGDVMFDPTRRDDYLILGGINVAYFCLVIVLGMAGATGSFLTFLLSVIYMAACHFGYPLVEFDRVKPVDALKSSLQIAKMNWKPGVVYFLVSIVFGILSVLALGVGFLIFFPLLFITRYASYQVILNK